MKRKEGKKEGRAVMAGKAERQKGRKRKREMERKKP